MPYILDSPVLGPQENENAPIPVSEEIRRIRGYPQPDTNIFSPSMLNQYGEIVLHPTPIPRDQENGVEVDNMEELPPPYYSEDIEDLTVDVFALIAPMPPSSTLRDSDREALANGQWTAEPLTNGELEHQESERGGGEVEQEEGNMEELPPPYDGEDFEDASQEVNRFIAPANTLRDSDRESPAYGEWNVRRLVDGVHARRVSETEIEDTDSNSMEELPLLPNDHEDVAAQYIPFTNIPRSSERGMRTYREWVIRRLADRMHNARNTTPRSSDREMPQHRERTVERSVDGVHARNAPRSSEREMPQDREWTVERLVDGVHALRVSQTEIEDTEEAPESQGGEAEVAVAETEPGETEPGEPDSSDSSDSASDSSEEFEFEFDVEIEVDDPNVEVIVSGSDSEDEDDEDGEEREREREGMILRISVVRD